MLRVNITKANRFMTKTKQPQITGNVLHKIGDGYTIVN